MKRNFYIDVAHFVFVILPIINLIFFLKDFYSFTVLKFLYLGNLLLLIPLFISDLRRREYLGFWVFILPLMYSFPWIFFGLDLTDEIYNFTASWFYPVRGLVTSFSPLSFASTHLWLRFFDTPFVLWGRFINGFVLSLILFSSFSLLKIFMDKKNIRKLWLLILMVYFILGLMSYVKNFFTPYDKIPVLYTVVSLLFFYKAYNSNKKLFFFLSGFFFLLALYSRFTYFFLLPVLYAFLFLYHKRYKDLYSFILGFIPGLFILYVFNIDLLYGFKAVKLVSGENNIFCFIDKTHSITYLLKSYFREFVILIVFILFFAFLINLDKFKIFAFIKKKYWYSVWFFVIVFLAFINFYIPKQHWRWFAISFSLSAAISITVIFYRNLKENFFSFFVASVFVFLLAFLGSNVGFQKIQYNFASAFVFPIFLIFAYKKIDKFIFFLTLLYLPIFGVSLKLIPYRDYPIKYLTESFSVKPLAGIYSYPYKVKEIEAFYNEIKEFPIKDRGYITVNKTFVFSILLNKEPLVLCWRMYPEIFSDKKFAYYQPEHILFSNRYLGFYNWDKIDVVENPKDTENYFRVIKIKKALSSNFTIKTISPHKIFVLYTPKN